MKCARRNEVCEKCADECQLILWLASGASNGERAAATVSVLAAQYSKGWAWQRPRRVAGVPASSRLPSSARISFKSLEDAASPARVRLRVAVPRSSAPLAVPEQAVRSGHITRVGGTMATGRPSWRHRQRR